MIRRLLSTLDPRRIWNALWSNPVILKEMRSRMRGWRATAGLSAFLLLIGITVGMIYLGFVGSGSIAQGVTVRKNIGQSIFYTLYMIELFIVVLAAPGLTSGAIAAEREHQTYDLLRTTLLSARSLVVGKLIAAVSFVLLLLIAALPLLSIGFVFGGISLGEVVLGTLIIVLSAMTFGAIGLLFSSFIHRPRIASVLAQVTSFAIAVVIPIFAVVAIGIFSSMYYTNSSVPELVFLLVGWLVAISSPIATAFITELILLEEQTYFFIEVPIQSSHIWVPSPWLGFIVLYPLLLLLLLKITISIVKRPDK